jgi:hypothetical protein
METLIKDMKGEVFTEGCKFLKAYTSGRSAYLQECVASLRNGKLYQGGSKVAIWYPERCYIL